MLHNAAPLCLTPQEVGNPCRGDSLSQSVCNDKECKVTLLVWRSKPVFIKTEHNLTNQMVNQLYGNPYEWFSLVPQGLGVITVT